MTTEAHAEWDDNFHDYMRCPHCGKEDQESSDYPMSLKRDGDTTLVDCGFCSKMFRVTLCVEYTYATLPLPDDVELTQESKDHA